MRAENMNTKGRKKVTEIWNFLICSPTKKSLQKIIARKKNSKKLGKNLTLYFHSISYEKKKKEN